MGAGSHTKRDSRSGTKSHVVTFFDQQMAAEETHRKHIALNVHVAHVQVYMRVFPLVSTRGKNQEAMLGTNMSSEGLNRAQPKTPVQFVSSLRECYDDAGSYRPKLTV